LIAKAAIINKGIVNINVEDCLINNSLMAGSSRYAIAEVLPAKRSEKKTDKNILGKYFFV
tara:strand:- start:815 stop:994 length:180 start_codon:yes stop_codon:yes gene_type:complete